MYAIYANDNGKSLEVYAKSGARHTLSVGTPDY